MKKILFCVILILDLCMSQAYAKKEKEEPRVQYEIMGAGTGTQGSYLVEISILSKKKSVTDSQLISAAVHVVLFRGFSNPNGRNSQKPLAGTAANEAQHVEFYSEFFSENGLSKTFGTVIKGTRNITKAGKEYRVSAKVAVEKESLLKYLEGAGVIRSLNSAF